MAGSQSHRSIRDPDPGTDLMSLTIGLIGVGARGLRTALGQPIPAGKLGDIALGAAIVSVDLAAKAADSARRLKRSRAFRLFQLPTSSPAWHPPRVVEELQQRGQRARIDDTKVAERVIDSLVPMIAEEVVRRVDLDALIQKHVNIDQIISGVLDEVVATVDVDTVASRVDIDAVLNRIDLNAVVRDRLDVNAVVRDVNIDAVAARLNLDAVIERLDLPHLAQDVIDEIDLPAIIRESSGSMASEAVSGVRMHSIAADQAVHSTVERIFRHRRDVAAKALVTTQVPATNIAAAAEMREPAIGVSEPSTRPTP